MDKDEGQSKSSTGESSCSKEISSVKSKTTKRGKKRKLSTSESSSEFEDVLPENTLQVEKSVHASAIKNNLDDISVRKILKKVVANDHVLAIVKLREEEEREKERPQEKVLQPKLTRAKVKELMKVSPKAWNLENLELTPIKHIPVKTRPEVKALIAQELPEDEDDEEYEPTHDDVPSDDDQGLESCSDLDSQPRTPATPRSVNAESPRVLKDGPFKIPQSVATPTRRILDLEEEEATIALRTRSKLSLSATSIEHIESTFVPPDDIPMPDVDDLWNQFLNECLNPASTSKHEDDDEADPEYNVAADPDANDEDEEALGNSIIKISKKELNDLVTELFNIMPNETAGDDAIMPDNLANSVLTDTSQTEVSTRWEGKQEPVSDDDNNDRQKLSDKITFEKRSYSRISIGKSEPPDIEEEKELEETTENIPAPEKNDTFYSTSKEKTSQSTEESRKSCTPIVCVSEKQEVSRSGLRGAPPLLQRHMKPAVHNYEYVHIQLQSSQAVLPEQVKILQQQLRQHIQLATSNFLQLYVHPVHWKYAPQFKEYLETFIKLAESNSKSVVNVCNLKPAFELVKTWEKTLSANTPENAAIVEFIQQQVDRTLRRSNNKSLYLGEFHETFLKVVANSSVFLYPYLLPPMPYRGDTPRKYSYLLSEDELIALGLQQFSDYVANNPSIYKPDPRKKCQPHERWGLKVITQLVIKHMFPWVPYKMLSSHIHNAKRTRDEQNPIYRFFKNREVIPVKHVLLPFNPQLTLYEQPEEEVPRIWVRYLAKTSKRFRAYLLRRKHVTGRAPTGVEVQLGQLVSEPSKTPQSIGFSKQINSHITNVVPGVTATADKFDIQIGNNNQTQPLQPQVVSNLYKFVETSTGAYLVPLTSTTMTVDSNSGPITTPIAIPSNIIANDLPETTQTAKPTEKANLQSSEHCSCCILLRKICKERQALISDFFGAKKSDKCSCRDKKYPKVTNRLKLLVDNYRNNYISILETLQQKLLRFDKRCKERLIDDSDYNIDDIAHVTKFHLKLITRTVIAKQAYLKRRVYNLLSKFDPQKHDPLTLAAELDHAFGAELVDLYKDFLVFLTAEQADKLNSFKDYFVRNCVIDIVKRIEEEVKDEVKQRTMLEELNRVFTKNLATACEICTSLLTTMDGFPKLAQYVHSLFPHRKEKSAPEKLPDSTPQKTLEPDKPVEDATLCEDTTMNDAQNTMDYEADESMSEDELIISDNASVCNSESESNNDVAIEIKEENLLPKNDSVHNDDDRTMSTPTSIVIKVNKTEVQDFNECSNTSMKIVFEEEVKTEAPEWKRDEDKLILEMLKEHLTPQERLDKTLLEIIDEKNIVNMISESLTHKSKSDIKTRLLYLLELC